MKTIKYVGMLLVAAIIVTPFLSQKAIAAEAQYAVAEGTPIRYTASTPSTYLETAIISYNALPENVRTFMADTGLSIYITKKAEVKNLPNSDKAGKLTGGYTLIYRKNPALTYISLQSDADAKEATIPLIHEAGHYVDAYCDSLLKDYVSNTQQFIDLAAQYGGTLRIISEKYTNLVLHIDKRSEMYAQAFVMMICFPDVLAAEAPELYDYMIATTGMVGASN